jgi:hypothetical protein
MCAFVNGVYFGLHVTVVFSLTAAVIVPSIRPDSLGNFLDIAISAQVRSTVRLFSLIR